MTDWKGRARVWVAALSIALAIAGCVTTGPAGDSAIHGDAARPGQAKGWARSELYFSVGNEDGSDTIDEAQWRAFLDREITPRFPDGLTVLDGYGQWLFREQGRLVRQRSKVLVVLHEDNAQRRADIGAIRAAWKRATGHESVLWARQAVDVSF